MNIYRTSKVSRLKTTYGQLLRWDWLRCHAEARANHIGCGKRLSIIAYKLPSGLTCHVYTAEKAKLNTAASRVMEKLALRFFTSFHR
jgi:hypothetical protein